MLGGSSMQVLMQVLTLFLLMLCGLFSAKGKLLDERQIAGLNTFVLSFAQPCLILSSMQRDRSPELIRDLLLVFVCTCVIITVSGLIAHRLFRKEPKDRHAVLTNLAMVSNCGFMGYPVITAALGEGALIYAALYVSAFNLMSWTLCAYCYGGKEAMRPKQLLKSPSLLAVIGGMVLFLTGWRLPGFVNNALSMLGETTTPLAMFVIGTRLMGLRKEHLTDRSLLSVCGLRLLIFPLAVWLLSLTPLPRMVTSALFLCTAMPCAALTAMMAEMYHSDRTLASRGVALSTALSMVTVPLLLMLI